MKKLVLLISILLISSISLFSQKFIITNGYDFDAQRPNTVSIENDSLVELKLNNSIHKMFVSEFWEFENGSITYVLNSSSDFSGKYYELSLIKLSNLCYELSISFDEFEFVYYSEIQKQ